MKKLIFLILIVALVVFLVSKFGADRILNGSLPGDFLYSLKKSWEWANLNLLTFTDEGKVKLELKFMQERVSELEQLQKDGKLTVEKAKQLTDEYNNLAQSVNKGITDIQGAQNSVDSLVRQAQEISQKHKGAVDEIIKSAPGTTADLLKKASDLGESLFKKISR
ncbi:hypothetical protein HY249_03280 [Candidatus Azambacteria bacterium]|nr:hypothetical protein [Candidatus Azambacteria bacterium]